MSVWTVAPDWAGETAFIIAGGPSVSKQPIDRLRGRRVIVINSSLHAFPWADICFFGDLRWWLEKKNRDAVLAFSGIAVTTSKGVKSDVVRHLTKASVPGLSTNPAAVMMKRTSLTGAINIAAHLGCPRIVLLGADGQRDGGRTHHHAPHRWPTRPGCWQEQKKDLVTLVQPLRDRQIEVLNASPGSAWDMWPIVSLEDVLDQEAMNAAPELMAAAG